MAVRWNCRIKLYVANAERGADTAARIANASESADGRTGLQICCDFLKIRLETEQGLLLVAECRFDL
jgi:hypothetical protein